MDRSTPAGYRERAHTADWALDVWAPDLAGLLEQAARGMYALMETQRKPGASVYREVKLEGQASPEDLLVAFLSELLYEVEQNGVVFDSFDLRIGADGLGASLQGAELAAQSKEIKAVTYHHLEIREEGGNLACTIVFDV